MNHATINCLLLGYVVILAVGVVLSLRSKSRSTRRNTMTVIVPLIVIAGIWTIVVLYFIPREWCAHLRPLSSGVI